MKRSIRCSDRAPGRAVREQLGLAKVRTAAHWAEISTPVGLAPNFAAVRALATEGIRRGHLSLHARTVATSAGVTSEGLPVVVARLIADVRFDRERRKPG